MGHTVPPIPESLRENLAYELGEVEAERWLGHAVGRAEELFEAWDLVPQQVLSGGSESLCVKCDGRDGASVLKLPASVTSGAAEIAALRAWAGDGAARVIRDEPGESAMLMNWLGWVGEGDFTVAEVLDVADRLHAADPSGFAFPSVETNLARRRAWAGDRFAEAGHQQALADVDLAEKILAELLYDGDPRVLLHGDLQPKNVIVSDDGLAVVDPMPSLGPAVFDLAFWVVKCSQAHPLPECQDEVLDLRPDVDRHALQRWAWCLAVLESRPYLGEPNRWREQFINSFRDQVA